MKPDNKFELLEKIASEAEHIISNSIKNRGSLGDWRSLQDIETISGGEHDWIPELAKNIISSATLFNKISHLPGQQNFMVNYEARISMGEFGPMSMNLEIRGVDDSSQKLIETCIVGGDTGLKNKDGSSIVVQKNTQGFLDDDVREASEKLTAFFVNKLEKKFNGEK
jgi:hypothetical protein